jgi:hypothetical protein
MEEMLDDTLEAVGDDEELEEEADAEVDKVLFEITDGKLGQAGTVGTELPVRAAQSPMKRTYTSAHRPQKRRRKNRRRT